MKKNLKILALLLAMLMVFTACGSKEGSTDGSENNSSAAAPSPFDFSSAFGDNGYWTGVTAKDYVTLGNYADYKVDEADVDTLIQYYLSSFPKSTNVYEGVVEDGDAVNIDYVGTVDGVAFDGGSTQGQGTEVIIGYTQYIDDFLQQLIGHSVGDNFDIHVTFPEDYGVENLNGKDAVFNTTINYIVEYEPNELSDEFVANNLSTSYGWETVSEMRDGIIQNMAMQNAYSQSEISEVPQVMLDFVHDQIKSEVDIYWNYAQQLAAQYSIEPETVLYEMVGYETYDDYLAGALEGYEEQASLNLFQQALAEDLGITASDKEVAARVATIADENVSYDQLVEYYGLNFMKWQVVVENTMKKLGDMAK